MNELIEPPNPSNTGLEKLPDEIEKLPTEMKTMVSVMAGFFRSTSGPDPETARLMAQSEMHEESCRLEGYKQALINRDQQSQRDHIFRMKQSTQDMVKSILMTLVCVAGIICGLYLVVAKKDNAVGTPILVASFMAMLGGKSLLPKDKD
jgi:hypothetical protein